MSRGVTLDASVLIAFLEPADASHARSVALMHRIGPGPHAVSTITLAETLVGPARAGILDAVTAALTSLGVQEHLLPEDAATALARLRAQTRLKLPDCCVLLTAQHHGTTLATFDDTLARTARQLEVPLSD